MIDDYDESSGWMFLLVPAHPGFPGQIPQSRKTVVCVCVSVWEKEWRSYGCWQWWIYGKSWTGMRSCTCIVIKWSAARPRVGAF